MKFIKLYIFISLVLLTFNIQSQSINVNVVILPPYTPYFEDYSELEDKVIITLTNTSAQSIEVYLKGKLYNQDESFVAQTKEGYVPTNFITLIPNVPYTIQGNEQLLEFFNEDNIELINGFDFENLANAGQLPEGLYNFCLGVYDKNDLAATTKLNGAEPLGCATFSISYLIPPQLICNHTIHKNEPQNITFNWVKPFSSNPTHQFKYDFYIVKVENENDNPQDLINNAIEGNGVNAVIILNLTEPMLFYDQSKPYLQNGNYVWAVVAKEVTSNFPIHNNGLSEVCTFTYNNLVVEPQGVAAAGGQGPVDCSCKSSLPANLNSALANQIIAGTKIKTSHFEMEVASASFSGGAFSGNGYIPIPILNNSYVKLNVEFSDLQIKTDGQNFYHTSGLIKAKQNPNGASMLPIVDPLNPSGLMLGPSQIQGFSNYFTNSANQLISNIKNQANSIAYSLPIGLDENIMNIAITDVVFGFDQAHFDAVTVLNVIDGNTKVGFVGKGICVDNSSFCGQAKVYLSNDIDISSIGIKLKGGETGTLISFNKDGFDELSIKASYTFPAGTLVKESTKTPLVLNIESNTKKGWSDWVAHVTFEPFHIAGFDDFKFSADNNISIQYDHSEVRNPEGIPSPYTMEGETPIATDLPTWQGIFLPSLKITLPAAFKSGDNKPIEATIKNLIFDGGLTGSVNVENILSISDGNVDSWYFSIERFKLDLWKNTFKKSSLTGKIVLPVSKQHTNASNQLDYACTLTRPTNQDLSFNFSIVPKDRVEFNVLWANANFIQGSEIRLVKQGGSDVFAKATLHGQITFNSNIKELPNVKLAEIKFNGLGVQTQSPYFTGSPTFSLGSPDHSVAGFSIAIDKVSLDLQGTDVGLKFDVKLKLVKADFVPKAEVVLGIYGKVNFINGRPAWDGFDAKLFKIRLDAGAKIGPVGVVGTIAYYNDQAGSYGFIGGLNMKIDNVVEVNAKAQFGYQATGDFNYFFIDALADFGSSGVVMVPGIVSLYGFGGGVFYNMTSNNSPATPVNGVKAEFNPNDIQAGKSLSGMIYTPSLGKFSIGAKILFGYTARALLDADGTIAAEINTISGGLSHIDFNLRGRIINNPKLSLEERQDKAMGIAKIDMRMNFQEGSFLFHAGINAGAPTHKDEFFFKLRAHLNFYAGPSGWFIHIGRPLPGKTVNISVANAFTFDSYFQAGNGSGQVFEGSNIIGTNAVDPLPPIPAFIENILNRAKNGGDNRINSLSSINRPPVTVPKGGIVLGASFTKQFDASFAIFFARAQFMAGFDLGLVEQSQKTYCQTNNGKVEMGSNGYYAFGQGYIGAEVAAGVHVKLGFIDERVVFAEAGIAAYIQVGTPNPTFASGELGGYFNVLGGLMKGGFHLPFTLGEKCESVNSEEVAVISEITPEVQFDSKNYNSRKRVQKDQDVYLRPTVTLNYMIDKTFLLISENPTDPSKRKYRFYHILPEDIVCNIYKKGSSPSSKYSFRDFEKSADHYSLILKRELLFEKETEFNMDVDVKIRVAEIAGSSTLGGQSGGYQNSNLGNATWRFAQNDQGGTYVDFRRLEFKTNCGMKKVEDRFVADFNPMHRSQNNVLYNEPAFNKTELKTASSSMNINSQNNAIHRANEEKYFHILNLGLNIPVLTSSYLCIPPALINNSDFYLKVNTFSKGADIDSKVSKYYKANVIGNKSLSAQLSEALPPNSYVVVQAMLKAKPKIIGNNTYLGSHFLQAKSINDFVINKRVLSLDQALKEEPDEMLLYEWYFTTGGFDTYRIKMKDLEITKDTFTTYKELGVSSFAGSGIAIHSYKVLSSKYTFLGNERFDIHDLKNYTLKDVLKDVDRDKNYEPKLQSGYLGFAFDNKSQGVIDSFLKTFVDNNNLEFSGLNRLPPVVTDQVNSYILYKMDELCDWQMIEKKNILPFLNGYPSSLNSQNYSVSKSTTNSAPVYLSQNVMKTNFNPNSSVIKNIISGKSELFILEKIAAIREYKGVRVDGGNIKLGLNQFTIGGKEVINPSIINLTLDILNTMNPTMINNLNAGFGPKIINKFN